LEDEALPHGASFRTSAGESGPPTEYVETLREKDPDIFYLRVLENDERSGLRVKRSLPVLTVRSLSTSIEGLDAIQTRQQQQTRIPV